MNSFLQTIVRTLVVAALSLAAARGADSQPKLSGFVEGFRQLLDTNLTISLKGLSATDGDKTTFGVEYKFAPKLITRDLGPSGLTAFSLSVRSEGLVTFDSKKSPNRLLTHGIRLSIDNLLSSRFTAPPANVVEAGKIVLDDQRKWAVLQARISNPATSKDEVERLKAQAQEVVDQANVKLGRLRVPQVTPGSTNLPGTTPNLWYVHQADLKGANAADRTYGQGAIAWPPGKSDSAFVSLLSPEVRKHLGTSVPALEVLGLVTEDHAAWLKLSQEAAKPGVSEDDRARLRSEQQRLLEHAKDQLRQGRLPEVVVGAAELRGTGPSDWYFRIAELQTLALPDSELGGGPGVGLARSGTREYVPLTEVLARNYVHTSPLLLSWDLDGNLETDQTFTDMQWVGSTQARLLLVRDWFDKPFALIRGYDVPRDPHNRLGGPYLYGGIGIVDPSSNEARKNLLGSENEAFLRAHAGVNFRTELIEMAGMLVSLELDWKYYHEFDAPRLIQEKHLEDTSYFRAALLFPKGLFIEYTDGKLPLDLVNSQTVAAGLRYSF
jgi:hypothetical protein